MAAFHKNSKNDCSWNLEGIGLEILKDIGALIRTHWLCGSWKDWCERSLLNGEQRLPNNTFVCASFLRSLNHDL